MRLLVSLAACSLVVAASASYHCVNFDVPLSFTATSAPPFPRFQNHYEAVGLLEALTSRNVSISIVGGPTNVSVDVTLAAQYCRPKNGGGEVVQVLTHGIGFDHTYWAFQSPESQYNYIAAATAAGYATLSYDRLGTGNSTYADPYTIVQQGIEIQVLIELTTLLRTGALSKHAGTKIPKPAKIAHIGHSFGSTITSGLAATAPSLSDGVVLTGYSTNGTWGIDFAMSSGFHLAAETVPERFGTLDKGYLTWPDELSNQFLFFHYPAFDPKVLAVAEETKAAFAIGEIGNVTGGAAPAWDGPLLIISGEYDKLLCGSDCYGILEQARPSYPHAKPFETYVQPDMGHGLNFHYNATGFFGVVNDFVKRTVG